MATDPLFYLRGPVASIAADFQKRIARLYWMGRAALRAVHDDRHEGLPSPLALPCVDLGATGFRWDSVGIADTENWLRGSTVRTAFEQLWHHHHFLWVLTKLGDPVVRTRLNVKAGTTLTNHQVVGLFPKEFRAFDRGGLVKQLEFFEREFGYRPWLADELISLNELRAALTHSRGVWEPHRGPLYVVAVRIESTLDHATDIWFSGGVPPADSGPNSRSRMVMQRREIPVGSNDLVQLTDEDVLDILHTIATYGNGVASCLAAHQEGKRWPECVLGKFPAEPRKK